MDSTLNDLPAKSLRPSPIALANGTRIAAPVASRPLTEQERWLTEFLSPPSLDSRETHTFDYDSCQSK